MIEEETSGSPPPEASPVPGRQSLAGSLEAWFAEHVHGSAVAARTDLYNRVHQAKEALRRILGEIEEMI